MDVHPEGEPERRNPETAALSVVSDGYFRLMRIAIREGRTFKDERATAPPIAIVSDSVARRYFRGRAVGKRVILPEFLFNIDGGKERPVEIVGVAGNVCVSSVADCDAEFIYVPERQNVLRMENLLVRTAGEPMSVAQAVRHAVFLEAPTTPLDDPQTLQSRTGYLSDGPRRAMWLLGVFAALAIVLAGVGIFGVASYIAVQRQREIGIRIALGAGSHDIARLVYRSVMIPSLIGRRSASRPPPV